MLGSSLWLWFCRAAGLLLPQQGWPGQAAAESSSVSWSTEALRASKVAWESFFSQRGCHGVGILCWGGGWAPHLEIPAHLGDEEAPGGLGSPGSSGILSSSGALGGSGVQGRGGGELSGQGFMSGQVSLDGVLRGGVADVGFSTKGSLEVWSGGVAVRVAALVVLCTMAWFQWAGVVDLTSVLGLLLAPWRSHPFWWFFRSFMALNSVPQRMQ